MKRWEKYRKDNYGHEKFTFEEMLMDIKCRCNAQQFGHRCEWCPLKDCPMCVGISITDDESIEYLQEVYHENN